jgi:hypothetical protein
LRVGGQLSSIRHRGEFFSTYYRLSQLQVRGPVP